MRNRSWTAAVATRARGREMRRATRGMIARRRAPSEQSSRWGALHGRGSVEQAAWPRRACGRGGLDRSWRLRWQIMDPQEWGARGMLTYHLKVKETILDQQCSIRSLGRATRQEKCARGRRRYSKPGRRDFESRKGRELWVEERLVRLAGGGQLNEVEYSIPRGRSL